MKFYIKDDIIKTKKSIKFAPVFDNGLSLFNYAMKDEISDLNNYSKTRLSAFGIPFEDIVKEFIKNRQKQKLRKMINFKFKKHVRYNLPDYRLKAIENFLQGRVKELIDIKNKTE